MSDSASPENVMTSQSQTMVASPASAASHTDPRRTGRILWIDDEPAVCELIETVLRISGHQVEVTTSGQQGVRLACDRAWDLIGLDLVLADLDGAEVLSRLRAAGVTAPVLVLTGYWDDSERLNRAWRAGATECQPKCLKNHELLESVERLMHRQEGASQTLATIPILSLLNWMSELDGLSLPGHQGAARPHLNREFQRRLVVAMMDREVKIPCFHACACALGRTVADETGGCSRASFDELDRAINAAVRTSRIRHRQVSRAVELLEAPLSASRAMSEEKLAREVGLSASHFGRLLYDFTGLDFRDWIRLNRLRTSVRALAGSTEQVKSIAHDVGWTSHTVLDDCFRSVFGLSPTEFRVAAWRLGGRPGPR